LHPAAPSVADPDRQQSPIAKTLKPEVVVLHPEMAADIDAADDDGGQEYEQEDELVSDSDKRTPDDDGKRRLLA
jgi:hypothetical protein